MVRAEDERAVDTRRGKLRELMTRVAARAVKMRQPRHRAHLERGWREIEALVFEGTSLRQLLLASGELSEAGDQRAFQSVRNAAYKRHERTRAALETAASAMSDDGTLGPAESELVRLAIASLARRRRHREPAEVA